MKNAFKWPDGWGLLLLGIAAATMVIIGIVVSYDPVARAAAALAPDMLPNPCDATCVAAQFDLKAQQHMAIAAWAMVIVTAVGTVTTAVSLVILWVTVGYSRTAAMAALESNRVAQEALVNENRAWVKVDIVRIESSLDWTPERAALAVLVSAKNVGSSPALNVSMTAALQTQPFGHFTPGDEAAAILAERITPPVTGYTIFPGDEVQIHYTISISTQQLEPFWDMWGARDVAPLRVAARANYVLSTGGDARITARHWDLNATPQNNSVGMGPANGNTARERLYLTQSHFLDTVAT